MIEETKLVFEGDKKLSKLSEAEDSLTKKEVQEIIDRVESDFKKKLKQHPEGDVRRWHWKRVNSKISV